jgi:hypothetical protein
MWRRIVVFVLGAAFTAAASLPGNGQEPKKNAPAANPQERKKATPAPIKGGIEGKVKKVDPDKMTVTVTVEGKERTFTITEDTTIVGPRGGLVKRGLKDPRFHDGLEITVVASGTKATELHLGVDHRDPGTTGDKAPKEPKAAVPPGAAAKGKEAAKQEAEEDREYPGKVKSVDPARHVLVISLLNGQDRSFMIAKDVKMSVKGTASQKGLEDPALKAGTPITVVTDAGGRTVKELKVAPPPASKANKDKYAADSGVPWPPGGRRVWARGPRARTPS